MPELNGLEKTVLDLQLAGDDPTLEILRIQLRAAATLSREFTGCGFSTHFAVPESMPRVNGRHNFEIFDVVADVAGLVAGAGFILFIRDGVLSFLEGVTYGDEEWPADVAAITPYYVHHEPADSPMLRPCGVRDLSQLRALWT
jgi:hypothetical protein